MMKKGRPPNEGSVLACVLVVLVSGVVVFLAIEVYRLRVQVRGVVTSHSSRMLDEVVRDLPRDVGVSTAATLEEFRSEMESRVTCLLRAQDQKTKQEFRRVKESAGAIKNMPNSHFTAVPSGVCISRDTCLVEQGGPRAPTGCDKRASREPASSGEDRSRDVCPPSPVSPSVPSSSPDDAAHTIALGSFVAFSTQGATGAGFESDITYLPVLSEPESTVVVCDVTDQDDEKVAL